MPVLGAAQRLLASNVTGQVPIIALHTEDPTAYIKEILRRGFTPIWLSELADALAGKTVLPAQPVCLTFDDGHSLWRTRNLAILQQYGVKASLCVTSDYLYSGTIAAFPEGGGMTWTQAREMHASGLFDWQVHGKTHQTMAPLTLSQLTTEVNTCRDAIVSELGCRTPVAVIYPYGAGGQATGAKLATLGYELGLTIGCLHPDRHPGTAKYSLERAGYVGDLLRWAEQQVIHDSNHDDVGGRNASNALGFWTVPAQTSWSGGSLYLDSTSTGNALSAVTTDYFAVSARSLYARVTGTSISQSAGTARISVLQYDTDQVALPTIDLVTAGSTPASTTFDDRVPLHASCAFVRLEVAADAAFNGQWSAGSFRVHV